MNAPSELQRPTPETDRREFRMWGSMVMYADDARNLERQRDELADALLNLQRKMAGYADDGIRPDEWLMREWTEIIAAALAKVGAKA